MSGGMGNASEFEILDVIGFFMTVSSFCFAGSAGTAHCAFAGHDAAVLCVVDRIIPQKSRSGQILTCRFTQQFLWRK